MRQFQIILIVALIFTSCKKNGTFYPASTILNGVYAGGTVTYNFKDIAVMWKDGKIILMSDSLTENAIIHSIFVTNSHVYASGFSTKGLKISAVIWKDGVMTNLADTSTNSNAISVFATESGDVYVSGWDCKYGPANAVVWKNGIETFLTNTPTQNFGVFYQAWATKVFVMNNNCYVSGFERSGGKSIAKLWENGVVTNLTDGSNFASAYSVFVTAKDTYVAGGESIGTNANFGVAKIWKNHLSIPISDTTQNTVNNYHFANAFDLFVDAQNVYIAENEADSIGNYFKIWKNGNTSILNTNGYDKNFAQSLYVSGTDVFVAGSVGLITPYNYPSKACIWKNGFLNTLPDFSQGSCANGVFVKN